MATMKLLFNRKIDNIKAVRSITGLGLAEARDLVEKMDSFNQGPEVTVFLTGDQIAQFYADKNRGAIPQDFLLRDIQNVPVQNAFDLVR